MDSFSEFPSHTKLNSRHWTLPNLSSSSPYRQLVRSLHTYVRPCLSLIFLRDSAEHCTEKDRRWHSDQLSGLAPGFPWRSGWDGGGLEIIWVLVLPRCRRGTMSFPCDNGIQIQTLKIIRLQNGQPGMRCLFLRSGVKWLVLIFLAG